MLTLRLWAQFFIFLCFVVFCSDVDPDPALNFPSYGSGYGTLIPDPGKSSDPDSQHWCVGLWHIDTTVKIMYL